MLAFAYFFVTVFQ